MLHKLSPLHTPQNYESGQLTAQHRDQWWLIAENNGTLLTVMQDFSVAVIYQYGQKNKHLEQKPEGTVQTSILKATE